MTESTVFKKAKLAATLPSLASSSASAPAEPEPKGKGKARRKAKAKPKSSSQVEKPVSILGKVEASNVSKGLAADEELEEEEGDSAVRDKSWLDSLLGMVNVVFANKPDTMASAC